jgi:hypothetical protein
MNDSEILFPTIDTIEITDRRTKKVFKIDLFVPAGVGLLVLDKTESIRKIFMGKADEATIKDMYSIFGQFLKTKYHFMDEKWAYDNIDMTAAVILLMKISQPIIDYVKLLGIGATPERSPESCEGTEGCTTSSGS